MNRKAALANRAGNRLEARMEAALLDRQLGPFEREFKRAPGTPDFAWPDKRLAVFVDGCFWHRCREHSEAMREQRWEDKFEKVRARDLRANAALRSAGWLVLRFWEHDVAEDADGCAKVVGVALERRVRVRWIEGWR
ncbi:MAG: DUF559 domain-containing protein [bacterium]